MSAARVTPIARWWVAIMLALVAALFAASPADLSARPAPSADHHLSADGHFDHLAAVDHDHIGAAATAGAPELFAEALAPRLRTALLSVGLVFALALLWRLSPLHTPAVGRDPPRTSAVVLTGRAVLARLCIARR